jgi:hypothetical protein
MRRGKARSIVIAMRWDGASWDSVPAWCDAVLPLVKETPVQWSFPALPEGFRTWALDCFVSPLRARMKRQGDGLLPMGFSGAPHPLLTLDELEKELSWTAKNPWSTGIAEVFGARSTLLAPRMADLNRPAAVEAYRSKGIDWVGMECGFGSPLSCDGITLYPFSTACHGEPPSTVAGRAFRRALDRDEHPLLFVDLPSFPSISELKAYLSDLLEMLSSRGIGIAGLDSVRNPPNPMPVESAPQARWDAAQYLRKKLDAASAFQRKKRKKNDDYHAILCLLASPHAPGSLPAVGQDREKNGKVLIANMQGDVALSGSLFDVRFRGGRFCGLERQGRRLTPDIAASSSVTTSGKACPFKSKSSVSFEHSGGTGLRDELFTELECERGRKEIAGLTVEYEFREERPELVIRAELRYPRCDGVVVNGTAPLVFALSELDGSSPALIAVTCPDGSESRHLIREKHGWKTIPGMRWAVEANGALIQLSASSEAEKRWGLCLFRVTRRRGRRMLEVNPFGSSTPVAGASVSGLTERHTLLIGLLEGGVQARTGLPFETAAPHRAGRNAPGRGSRSREERARQPAGVGRDFQAPSKAGGKDS